MNPKILEKEWLKDFKDFAQSEGAPVPKELSQRILKQVHQGLHPSAWSVFAKLLGIHIVVGTLSLAICDQFGLSPFRTDFSLSDYFMRFGNSACMVLCGFIFIGLSVLLCKAVMSSEEFRVLARNAALQVFGLSTFSIVAFVAFGAEIVIGIGALWLLGAMLGGVLTAKIFARGYTFQ